MTQPLNQKLIRKIMRYDEAKKTLSVNYAAPIRMPTIYRVDKTTLSIDGKNYSLARLAYLYHFGVLLDRVMVKDRNRSNCAPENLKAPAYIKH